jgi:hypothetical protein
LRVDRRAIPKGNVRTKSPLDSKLALSTFWTPGRNRPGPVRNYLKEVVVLTMRRALRCDPRLSDEDVDDDEFDDEDECLDDDLDDLDDEEEDEDDEEL